MSRVALCKQLANIIFFSAFFRVGFSFISLRFLLPNKNKKIKRYFSHLLYPDRLGPDNHCSVDVVCTLCRIISNSSTTCTSVYFPPKIILHDVPFASEWSLSLHLHLPQYIDDDGRPRREKSHKYFSIETKCRENKNQCMKKHAIFLEITLF